jgi:hypothetical protein
VSRVRVGLGLLAVASGTAWAAGGIDSLTATARTLAFLLPLLLVVGGISTILRAVVPRGTLAGPVLLIAIGLIIFAVQHRTIRGSLSSQVPPFAIIAAGVLVSMSHNEKPRIDTGIERLNAFLFPSNRRVSGTAPRKFILRAVLGSLRLDLSQASYPGAARLWVDVTVLMGRIELIVPRDWEIKAGRVELARGVSFVGTLTSSELATPMEQESEVGASLVVLNIQGVGGAVEVQQA